MKTWLKRSGLLAVLCLFTLPAHAEVTATVISIRSDGTRIYNVPQGKVFMLEHVMFPNEWANVGKPRVLLIRPTSLGANAARILTKQYNTEWNMLSRPLRMPWPGGFEVGADSRELRIFLVGRLMDQDDLFGSIDSEIKRDTLDPAGTPSMLVDIETKTKRPAKAQLQVSNDDLASWTDVDADRQDASPGEIQMRISPLVSSRESYRAQVRVAPEEEYNPDYAFQAVQALIPSDGSP